MSYSNSSLQIHGLGSVLNAQPSMRMSLTASDVSRNGSTLSCTVKGTLNALSSPWYFGYKMEVYAQLDNGPMVQIISKPNSPNRWNSGTYGLGDKVISCTNNTTSCVLKILVKSNCGCKGSDEVVVAHSISLSAPANSYTVSYNANGGSDAPSPQTKYYGTSLTLTSAKPSGPWNVKLSFDTDPGQSSGFTHLQRKFIGWNAQANGSGTSYQPGQSFTVNANTTLYAQYGPGVVRDADMRTASKEGHTFAGWFTPSGEELKPGSEFNTATTVTARWIPDNHVISYDANGGTGAPAPQTKYQDVPLKLSSDVPSRKMKITCDANGGSVSPDHISLDIPFANWSRRSDGSGTTYSPGDLFTGNFSMTLYAQWGSAVIGQTPLPAPSRSGCRFVDWFSSRDGGSKITPTSAYNSNATIYARWDYIVEYDLNGGTLGDDSGTAIPNQIKEHQVNLILTSISPTKSGQEFLGWAESKSATSPDYLPGGTFVKNSPTTLYAVYGVQTHTVKFDLAGGSYTGGGQLVQSVEHGKSAVLPSNPHKQDSEFRGWIGDHTNIVKDTTIVALWNHCPLWIFKSDKQWHSYLD